MDSPHKESVMQSLVFLDLGKLLNENKNELTDFKRHYAYVTCDVIVNTLRLEK